MRIKTEHIRRLKNGTIKGYFILDDKYKSKVKFNCTKDYSWNQWGAPKAMLLVTMPRVVELQEELYSLQ